MIVRPQGNDMDITNATTARIDVGIDHLTSGGSISYYDVALNLDRTKSPNELVISSYSENFHIENVQESKAEKKMKLSKDVAEELAEKSEKFELLWGGVRHHFIFSYNYDKCAILLAEEIDGTIV